MLDEAERTPVIAQVVEVCTIAGSRHIHNAPLPDHPAGLRRSLATSLEPFHPDTPLTPPRPRTPPPPLQVAAAPPAAVLGRARAALREGHQLLRRRVAAQAGLERYFYTRPRCYLTTSVL